MVRLTATAAAKAAIDEYCRQKETDAETLAIDGETIWEDLSHVEPGSPVEHNHLIEVSKYLVERSKARGDETKSWRLDSLLKGALVYQPPLPPKPEPTAEYKALMRRLRAREEQRQYERMVNPPMPGETFDRRFPEAGARTFNPSISHGQTGVDEVDEVTYADVNRQMILIINILVSIITCSVFIWIAARRWSVPQRLGLSMFGSGTVAAAEVAIYFGYIRRLDEAKQKEVKAVERKEVVETWVTDKVKSSGANHSDTVRSRKGKHR
ncbi:hypothetical protein LTR53_012724 [Teratosphaeriaceae sp. CCFEE 6253]|nr:hypothetical protein LTR53_012724 [Teratosphaeriaceae sp. CCFEE 6253]